MVPVGRLVDLADGVRLEVHLAADGLDVVQDGLDLVGQLGRVRALVVEHGQVQPLQRGQVVVDLGGHPLAATRDVPQVAQLGVERLAGHLVLLASHRVAGVFDLAVQVLDAPGQVGGAGASGLSLHLVPLAGQPEDAQHEVLGALGQVAIGRRVPAITEHLLDPGVEGHGALAELEHLTVEGGFDLLEGLGHRIPLQPDLPRHQRHADHEAKDGAVGGLGHEGGHVAHKAQPRAEGEHHVLGQNQRSTDGQGHQVPSPIPQVTAGDDPRGHAEHQQPEPDVTGRGVGQRLVAQTTQQPHAQGQQPRGDGGLARGGRCRQAQHRGHHGEPQCPGRVPHGPRGQRRQEHGRLGPPEPGQHQTDQEGQQAQARSHQGQTKHLEVKGRVISKT